MNKKAKIGLIILAFIILTISTKVYATNGKANQETVRMRKEASTESSVVTLISLDEEVEVLSEEGEWYKIKYKTYTGYVRKDMLDVDGKTETAQNTNSENTTSSEEIKDKIEIGYTGTIASKLDLKLVPSITSSNINTIEENSKIIIKDIINKWSYVETDNKSGWVLTSKIKVSEQKNEEVKTEENKEQTVEETKKEENTEKTTSKEETKTEEKKKTEVTKYVSAETLNMRETANNNAKLINQLKVNTKVTVLETEGTWSKIKVNGKTGYVASKYLSDKKVDVTSRSEEISRGKQNTQTENTSSKNESNTQGTSSSASGNNIVAYAKKYMGYKYVSGGSSPSTGFDCSGFTSYVYKQCGISISRSSSAQASNGTAVSKSNLQPGDLVIFNNRANTSIGHVGIYIGGNTFIHAGNSGTGVITTSLSDSYYSARYVTGRRIIN
ncbi:MAG: SH3 domain-containing C40 family peptidase [Clostridia bacterium]